MKHLKTFPNGIILPQIDELEEARLNSGMSKKQFAKLWDDMKTPTDANNSDPEIETLILGTTIPGLDGEKLIDLSENKGVPKEYLGTNPKPKNQ